MRIPYRCLLSSSPSPRPRRSARPTAARRCAIPGFDLWCGDQLCAWKIERGDVAARADVERGRPRRRARRQRRRDRAALAGRQRRRHVHRVRSDRERRRRRRRSTLNVDVYGDGTRRAHRAHPDLALGAADVQARRSTAPYDGIRFELTKTGTGHAVLAQIGAKITDGCDAFTPITPAPAPLGAPCGDDDRLPSGICGSGRSSAACAWAAPAARAPADEVCGVERSDLAGARAATRVRADGSRELGEQCLLDSECASGICNVGYLLERASPAASTATARHVAPAMRAAVARHAPAATCHGPFVCAAGTHARAPGSRAATTTTARAGTCNGTPRLQCDDGRACATAADCPFGGLRTRLLYSRHPGWQLRVTSRRSNGGNAASDPAGGVSRLRPALVRKAERMLRSREDAVDVVHALFVDLIPRWNSSTWTFPTSIERLPTAASMSLRDRGTRARLLEREHAAGRAGRARAARRRGRRRRPDRRARRPARRGAPARCSSRASSTT